VRLNNTGNSSGRRSTLKSDGFGLTAWRPPQASSIPGATLKRSEGEQRSGITIGKCCPDCTDQADPLRQPEYLGLVV